MSTVILGPSGGESGQEFADCTIPIGAELKEIHIFAERYIDAIQIVYLNAEGETVAMPKIGGLGGQPYIFTLDDDEYLTGLSGHCDWYIDNLRFHTNKRASDFYGGYNEDGEFRYEAAPGSEIVGLFGRADWYIDAIGVVTRERVVETPAESPKEPRPAPKSSPPEPAPKEPEARPVAQKREPKPNDLKKVGGIGPKIAAILIENEIFDLQDLANTQVDRLEGILEAAGPRYKLADPTTWPEQAALGVKGDWEAMKKLRNK